MPNCVPTNARAQVSPSGPAGGGGSASARAAMPPAFLDATPDAPEALTSAATSDSSVRIAWQLPAGNPKVDSYAVKVVPVNATGWAARAFSFCVFESLWPLQPSTYMASA